VRTPEDPRYLGEESLGCFLRERFDEKVVHDKKLPNSDRNFRPDYRSDEHKLCVEFDGPHHYQRVKRFISDDAKERWLREEKGYRVVRIPYFVQLTEPVIGELFGDLVTDRTPFKKWPHGFIDENALLPAHFCGLGIQRFLEDLERFASIRSDILDSLTKATEKKGDWRLVYPPSLHDKLSRSIGESTRAI
jgi:hypothetical protein